MRTSIRKPGVFTELRWVIFFLSVSAGVYLAFTPALKAQEVQNIIALQSGVQMMRQITPIDAVRLEAVEAPQLSASLMETLLQGKLDRRRQQVSQVKNDPPGPSANVLLRGLETDVEGETSELDRVPATLVIGRNNLNTNANSNALDSTLAEPAAANNARNVFAAGNFSHAEFSSDGGATWANVPLPGGPAATPILCCDNDVVIDDARRTTFHSALYINSSLNTGSVRIFVRNNPPVADCAYDISFGANVVLPDFPHLGLTKNFLYLSMNVLVAGNGSFAFMVRLSMDPMVACGSPTLEAFAQSGSTFGQRVWVPAEGTNNIETMYWGQLDNVSTFRIFSWPEAAASPSSVTQTIAPSTFGEPDCRGGVGNFNFIDDTVASIAGFSLRGAAAPGAAGGSGVLAFYWQVRDDAQHTQGHIHAAVFSLSGFALLGEPHIFNNAFCFGFPIVTANKRGDLGITLAVGGRAGGGGVAAQGAVGIDDEFTPGIGVFDLVGTAGGTHNRSDGRYGDYFTIHPFEPCEKWFSATNYALNGGDAVANINSRYIEFGREQSIRCYRAHKDQAPTP